MIRRLPLIGMCLLLAEPALAARLASGPSFNLPADQTQVGDLYFGGSDLRLEGPVFGSIAAGCQTASVQSRLTGNLFLGCQTAEVSGPVGGDVVAFCQKLTIADSVAGAVRTGAASVRIEGAVGQDVVAGCGRLEIGSRSEVAGDVIAASGVFQLGGKVRGDVRVAANVIHVAGIVDGDLVCRVEDALVLGDSARVFGDLRYWSHEELNLGNTDAVFGTISFHRVEPPGELAELKKLGPRPSIITTLLLPFALISVIAALAVGFILLAIWRQAIVHALERALDRFGRTVGYGALALLVAPAAILVGFLLVITIPAAGICLLLYLSFLYLSKLLAGMFLGRWLFSLFGGQSASPWLTAPVGIILVYALCAIPFVGPAVWLFGAMIGFGVILELFGISRRP